MENKNTSSSAETSEALDSLLKASRYYPATNKDSDPEAASNFRAAQLKEAVSKAEAAHAALLDSAHDIALSEGADSPKLDALMAKKSLLEHRMEFLNRHARVLQSGRKDEAAETVSKAAASKALGKPKYRAFNDIQYPDAGKQ